MKQIYLQIILIGFTVTGGASQVNFDESLVSDFELPDILISQSGEKIGTSRQWASVRRQEVLEMFKKYVYGDIDTNEMKVVFETSASFSPAMCNRAIRKNISMYFIKNKDTIKTDLLIYTPLINKDEPVPLFVGMKFFGNQTIHFDPDIPITNNYVTNKPEANIFNHKATDESRGVRANRWPIERIIERGYGIATIYYGDIDPDFDDKFKNGLHKLLETPEESGSDKRSSISAWAFALSNAMNYFETDGQINHQQIVVIGHSRLGKAALWAGAIDQRFAITISNNSGCGGAVVSRRKFGETVKAINNTFPHWFCRAFNQFNDKEELLPIDQHMLLALIAPRPVYVGSAFNNKWADPKGEYLSLFHSGAVYRLYGLPVFLQKSLPPLNESVCICKMGYHIRACNHELTRFDWEKYLDFADLHFRKK